MTEGKTEEWKHMLDINVLAVLIATREALQDMKRRGNNLLHSPIKHNHTMMITQGWMTGTSYIYPLCQATACPPVMVPQEFTLPPNSHFVL